MRRRSFLRGVAAAVATLALPAPRVAGALTDGEAAPPNSLTFSDGTVWVWVKETYSRSVYAYLIGAAGGDR